MLKTTNKTVVGIYQLNYSCLTFSDALTCPEVFPVYLRHKTKFWRNVLIDIFVKTYWSKAHVVMGLFHYEIY